MKGTILDDLNDTTAWLILSQTEGLGPVHLNQLYQQFGSAVDIVTHIISQQAPQRFYKSMMACNWGLIKKSIAWSCQKEHHLLHLEHPQYPALLQELAGAPPILYAKGQLSIIHNPQIAIVGSRKASPLSLHQAKKFAYDLSLLGYTITSGLALGIDGAAHQGALLAKGPSIAVLGSGINVIYPKKHHSLANQLIDNGLLLSEYPLDSPPRAHHFPKRNRIISGLSLGSIIVAAEIKSGSLITARYATEQNRQVFAIPGSIQSQEHCGCHHLIQQGAKLTTNIQDIVDELPIKTQPTEPTLSTSNQAVSSTSTLAKAHHDLLEYIDFSPTTVDFLVQNAEGSLAKIHSLLLYLEMNHYINRVPGGYMRVK